MKPAQHCIAAAVLGAFAVLVAAGALSAKRDVASAVETPLGEIAMVR